MTTTDIAPTTAASPTTGPATADGLALVTALDARLGRELGAVFACMEWAEEEITHARARHPRHADALFHSFALLTPTQDRMQTEFVYRSHCRELLGRVVAGADTRAGTAAEVCCAMLEVSLRAPLRSAAFGLYTRMWQAAEFPAFPELAELRVHHEALENTVIDDHERHVRRQLTVPGRHLRDVACAGRHHGVEIRCSYARPGQLALDDG